MLNIKVLRAGVILALPFFLNQIYYTLRRL